MHNHLGRVCLLIIILAAWVLRLYHLDAQSLWYDEGVTAHVVRRSLVELTQWTARDIQPPLYYYLVSGWGKGLARLGPSAPAWSEWSLRFPSVFCGVLTVPLLAALTMRLMRDRLAGLLAALFTALHPLLLYYSQEARMYAMLTALGVLTGYLLLRGTESGATGWRTWGAYALAATAAIYTHYFAFFLLLGLAVAALLDGAICRRLRRTVGPLIAANAVVLLFYAPWFVPLFTQLNVDASYWQGSLKLNEALRSIAIRFSSGETVLEAQAVWLLLPAALVTLIAVAALLIRAQAAFRRTLIYALCWLLIPIAGVLVLAAFVPKFNARYVMIALPGLIVLWSGGIGRIVNCQLSIANWQLGLHLSRVLLVAVCIICLTGLFVHANRNWFVDPAFTKAQWRAVAQYVRTHKATDERVLLVSGHAWPVWDYYAPDLPAARLPDLEILDVEAVLDYAEGADRLRTVLADQEGAWLVGWQDEVVDPMGVVPLHLARAGRAVPLDRTFWGLDLQRYADLDADAIAAAPPSNSAVNFGDQLLLTGHDVLAEGDLLLFWRVHPQAETPLPDYRMGGELRTADGLPYAHLVDQRPAGYDYPAFRWQAGDVMVHRIPAAEWAGAGAAPGRYTLRLGVYDPAGDVTGLDVLGAQGQPLGKRAALDVTLPQPVAADGFRIAGDGVDLLPAVTAAVHVEQDAAEPGQPFTVQSEWMAHEALAQEYELRVQWVDPAGSAAYTETQPLLPAFPTSRWPLGQVLRAVHQVRAPLDLPPGAYELHFALADAASASVRQPFTVLPSTRRFDAPPVVRSVDVLFGDQIRLLGTLEPLPTSVDAAQPISATLVWRAESAPAADYAVTVQWLDGAGAPQSQTDARLPDGASVWLPGQVVTQPLALAAPEEPGEYRLIAAVYDPDAAGLPRLMTPKSEDFITLTQTLVATLDCVIPKTVPGNCRNPHVNQSKTSTLYPPRTTPKHAIPIQSVPSTAVR